MGKMFNETEPDKGICARMTLYVCKVPVGADFHTLSTEQVEMLLVEANVWKYRKPRNANGSRGRYFHDYMQRLAARKA